MTLASTFSCWSIIFGAFSGTSMHYVARQKAQTKRKDYSCGTNEDVCTSTSGHLDTMQHIHTVTEATRNHWNPLFWHKFIDCVPDAYLQPSALCTHFFWRGAEFSSTQSTTKYFIVDNRQLNYTY